MRTLPLSGKRWLLKQDLFVTQLNAIVGIQVAGITVAAKVRLTPANVFALIDREKTILRESGFKASTI